MDGLVTTRAPARALAQARSVVHSADQNCARLDLLEMAFKTQVRVAFGEQFGVEAAVRGMAGRAAFAQGLVLENKRPLLGRMALDTVFVLRKQLGAAGDKSDTLMRWMTNGTTHPSFRYGMMIGQIKLAAHVQVTFVAGVFNRAGRFKRIPPA